MQSFPSGHSAEIIPFRPRGPTNRFTVRDRIETFGWIERARDAGYTRVIVAGGEPEDDPELGDFMLIYQRGSDWASWGIGMTSGRYTAWHQGTGVTLGVFATLTEALEAIMDAAPDARFTAFGVR